MFSLSYNVHKKKNLPQNNKIETVNRVSCTFESDTAPVRLRKQKIQFNYEGNDLRVAKKILKLISTLPFLIVHYLQSIKYTVS